MAVTFLPTVGRPAQATGFPSTDGSLVFAAGPLPITGKVTNVTITPGESLAAQAEREARNRRRRPLRELVSAAQYPPCPPSFRPFYQEVGPRFGVPWQVIEAIHQVESGKSCHTSRTSSGGAVGPMQFIPSTWRRYAWDCTGDGKADITNAFDAICTGAHYIGTGLTGFSLERAIYSYNHSWAYVDKVMRIAREIGLAY